MNNKSLEFYIKVNDYFSILATVISLIKQDIKKGKSKELNIFI